MSEDEVKVKSIEDVKEEFNSSGRSFADWAREHNFNPELVYKIIHNGRIPVRGESHKIAVKLGLKAHKELDF